MSSKMSYRVGVQSRIFRVFSLARRLLTDRLTPPPPPRAYISISDKRLGSAAGAHKSADRRGQVAKGDLVGHGV